MQLIRKSTAAAVVAGLATFAVPGAALNPSANAVATVSAPRASGATMSAATDAAGDQTIDLRKAKVKTTVRKVEITITTYDPVSDKTLSQCGRIQVSLGTTASLAITSNGRSVRARVKDGGNVHVMKISRPNPRAFSMRVRRAWIPSYVDAGSWLVAAEGGGFCQGPALEDVIPDRGRIVP